MNKQFNDAGTTEFPVQAQPDELELFNNWFEKFYLVPADAQDEAEVLARWVAWQARAALTPPVSAPIAVAPMGWINVGDRLPAKGVGVLVYSPPTEYDHPGYDNIRFDCIDPDGDGDNWLEHSEHYEHYCMVAVANMTGPSEKAPYTHWMPMPAAPQSSAVPVAAGQGIGIVNKTGLPLTTQMVGNVCEISLNAAVQESDKDKKWLEAIESCIKTGNITADQAQNIKFARAIMPTAAAQATIDPDDTTREQYRCMFLASCGDLAAISERLGLDPNDGGADPIIDAIEELQEARAAGQAQGDLPPLPMSFASVPRLDSTDCDVFTGDQMRGYALDYAMKLGRTALQSPPASEKPLDSKYRLIAHLVGTIFFAGDFKVETPNEDQLNRLLIEVGCKYQSWDEVDAGTNALSQPPAVEAPSDLPKDFDPVATLRKCVAHTDCADMIGIDKVLRYLAALPAALPKAEAATALTHQRMLNAGFVTCGSGIDGVLYLGTIKDAEALAPSAVQPAQGTQAVPDDFMSHRAAWRDALVLAKEKAEVSLPDTDDAAYWQHELDAFDCAYTELSAAPKPPAVRDGGKV